MRFFSSDKKPRLLDALIVTAAVLAAVLILTLVGRGRYALAASIILAAYFLYLALRLACGGAAQLKYDPYSYNTLYFFGFSLFMLSAFITFIILIVWLIKYPDLDGSGMVVYALFNSARVYMVYSVPFIIPFSAALLISNISLIRHERFRFVNVLGIILSLLLVGGEVFLYKYDYYVSGSWFEVMMHDVSSNIFAGLYLYFECMLIGQIVALAIVSRYEPAKDKSSVIILGCGIRKDGAPTPLLRGRMERALEFARRQEDETGRPVFFVTSGGQGPDEIISESECMKRYLMERGVPEERIIMEDRSRDTAENMRFSKQKLDEAGVGGKIAYSTTNYHVFRSGLYASRNGMRAEGMGAKTKWYFWPNAAVREFVGILTENRLRQALIIGGIMVFYIVLTIINYV